MLEHFFLGLGLTLATVTLHVAGLYLILRVLRPARKRQRVVAELARLGLVTFALLLVHALEMLLWAEAIQWQTSLTDFSDALYYSMSSYTTVGYGDVVPSGHERVIGPFEAIVGILMAGLSTAFLFRVAGPSWLAELPRHHP